MPNFYQKIIAITMSASLMLSFSAIRNTSSASLFSYKNTKNPIEEKKKEIENAEKEILEQKDKIKRKENELFSYGQYLDLLSQKIHKTKLEQDFLKKEIDMTKLEIENSEQKISSEENNLFYQKKLLASYLRELQRYDDANKMLLLLQTSGLSDLYNKMNFTKNINGKTLDTTETIKASKRDLERDREIFVNKKLERESYYSTLQVQENELARAEEELGIMSKKNANEIKNLEDTVTHTEELREKLKQELFTLTREGQSIKFDEAAKEAIFASEKTGVRPALIMAIMKQETDFGINVGNGRYKTDMAEDQWDTFIKICLELGRDPENTPVSARPKTYRGMGGAMGIAQFLPETWMGVRGEVTAITGHNPPDPWNTTDAFVAVGIKMKRLGADRNNEETEWEAAGRYFAGGNFQNYPWYGNSVLKKAAIYEEQLKKIQLKPAN